MGSAPSVPKLRRASTNDAAALALLRNQLKDHFFSPIDATPEKTLELLQESQTYVAEANDIVIGSCAIYNRQDIIAEFGRLMVDAQYQGHGYGKALLEHAMGQAQQDGILC